MTNPLLVGADVHRKTNTICLMAGHSGTVGDEFTVNNNRPGAEALVREVASAVVAGDHDAIHIAAEATGWYWWHFFQTLAQDPTLNQWPVELYAFNPRLTANFKKAYVDLDHTDPIDAFVVADRLRFGRDLPVPFQYDKTYLPLRCLTRYRYHVVHDLSREKSYCLAMLYLKASEYTRPGTQPFANVFGAASRAVLQDFASLEDIAAVPFDELVEFIDVKGKRRFSDPTDNAQRLQRVAGDSYVLPQAMRQPVNHILGWCLQHIAFLERLIQRIDTAIAQLLAAIPHTLETIPGIGPVLAAGIIAEIGGVARFDYNQAKVAKYAGFKWRRTQSADFAADETRLTRTGNRYLRYLYIRTGTLPT
ncbi:MAG: IS110 family transposase [Chloroflexi bacterium]|nr:IS110 family transposase [Chloroflexota bacterium]MBU1751703.1 IS110 family transposase [Chloroflexota bacterium]